MLSDMYKFPIRLKLHQAGRGLLVDPDLVARIRFEQSNAQHWTYNLYSDYFSERSSVAACEPCDESAR